MNSDYRVADPTLIRKYWCEAVASVINPLKRVLQNSTPADVKEAGQGSMHALRSGNQLRLGDVLTAETLIILAVLAGALVLMPVVLIRHFKAIERAEVEHERSAYLATHDVLTQLPNRYLFADRFDQAFSDWKANGVPFAVLLIDLDHFKEINDKYGHEVGDQVLRAVANRMLQATRSCDTVARYGGDEFVILITDLSNPESAELKAAVRSEFSGFLDTSRNSQ